MYEISASSINFCFQFLCLRCNAAVFKFKSTLRIHSNVFQVVRQMNFKLKFVETLIYKLCITMHLIPHREHISCPL